MGVNMAQKGEVVKSKIYNSFINWWYREDIEDAINKVHRLELDEAVVVFEKLKQKINPKAYAVKRVERELNIRKNPVKKFVPLFESEELRKYREAQEL